MWGVISFMGFSGMLGLSCVCGIAIRGSAGWDDYAIMQGDLLANL